MTSNFFSVRGIDQCHFCEHFWSTARGRLEPWDTVLAQTDDCVVVPTKGALVPGWLLVIPKVHALRSMDLGERDSNSLWESVELAVDIVERNFGPATILEHGPVRHGSALGCGMDHVHMHVLPLPFSFTQELRTEPSVSGWMPNRVEASQSISLGEYVLVQEPGELITLALIDNPSRQLARQLIARKLGIAEQYDYAIFPQRDNVERTLDCIRESAA